MIQQEITGKIIKAFFEVYNTLGFGFLEKVYENALMHELILSGLYCEKQKPIKVYYKERLAGEYFADIIVNNYIVVEIKAAEGIVEEHESQLINYLKATNIEVGLLLNFGKKAEFKRKVFSNSRKNTFNINDN